MAPLSQAQEDAAHVAALVPDGGSTVLDLSDDRQYRHVVGVQIAAGNTPERCPGLHAALADARVDAGENGPPTLPQDDPWGSAAVIVAVGATPNGLAAARGYISVIDGADGLYANLVVTANGDELAGCEIKQFADGAYADIDTEDSSARPASEQMLATLNAVVIVDNKAVPVFAQAATANAAQDPVVHQPQSSHPANQFILIGLGRGLNSSTDVDYWFDQVNPDDGIYKCPLVCDVEFGEQMDASSLAFAAQLTRAAAQGGGTVNLASDQVQNVLNSTTWTSDSALTTSCPAPAGQNQSDNAMTFVDVKWSTEDTTYLTATFTATSSTGETMMAVIASSTATDDAIDGVATILPIVFAWHCVDGATPVRRADGSAVAIRELRAGDELQGPDGATRTVHSTWSAPHRGTITRLLTDAGDELLLSFNHVVMTPSGPRPASELAVGGTVNTEAGPATIAGLADEDYEGLLCNVSLGPTRAEADPSAHTFFAGGIESCDYEVQTQHQRRRLSDPDYVRGVLPERLLPDYENWLARA